MIGHYRDALSTILCDFVYYLSIEGAEFLLREAEHYRWGHLHEEVRELERVDL
jgi:hypothetical protein